MTRPRFAIGVSDFRKLREAGSIYVDKSALIDDILDAGAEALLIPRPRRMGKTLNLSMLRYFFEKSAEPRASLFDGLSIADSERARSHFQRYPVVFLTFKDVRAASWAQCLPALAEVLAGTYREHAYLLESGTLAPHDADTFAALLAGQATEVQCWRALSDLCRHLHAHHRERVVVLIDEYDTPIHAGYAGGFHDEAVTFFRNLLSGALKDSPHLFKGVLTGILRVAKESVFSGLNNLAVYSILRPELSNRFGFTEEETEALVRAASDASDAALLAGLRAWYDGYRFGGRVIYNPWSVLSFLDSADRQFRPYWVSTASTEIVRDLLITGPEGLRTELEVLLRGGEIEAPIDDAIALRDLAASPDALWSFLLFSGYLTATEVHVSDLGRMRARLRVPNREVLGALAGLVESWIKTQIGGSTELSRMLTALLGGDARSVERYLSRLVTASLSYHDLGGDTPERVFHAFVVGLLVSLGPDHEVRSNRESGYGRYDVMILPRAAGHPGVVLELKAIDTEAGETRDAALATALRQIEEKDYAAELRARGASPIHALAVVFDGKRAWVRAAS